MAYLSAMTTIVTRFHLLLLAVTLAITGVALFRVPAEFFYAAHWSGSVADWQWPRDLALTVAPVLASALLLGFFILGRLLTKNHFAKTQHILDPALTLLLGVVAATQLGLLLAGFGSDLDLIRLTGFGLGMVLLVAGVVLFEAERHTYAGLRLPWPIASDAAWQLTHRAAGAAFATAGAGLVALAWFDVGIGILVLGFAVAVVAPVIVAAVTTVLASRR
ncbi:MAG: SdpI family protein [Devosia sp.]